MSESNGTGSTGVSEKGRRATALIMAFVMLAGGLGVLLPIAEEVAGATILVDGWTDPVLLAGGGQMSISNDVIHILTSSGHMKSEDRGQTWTTPSGPTGIAMVVNGEDIYIAQRFDDGFPGVAHIEIYKSTNGGDNWTTEYTSEIFMDLPQDIDLAYSNGVVHLAYVTGSEGFYRNSLDWDVVKTNCDFPLGMGCYTTDIVADDSFARIITHYSPSPSVRDAKLYESNNSGGNWTHVGTYYDDGYGPKVSLGGFATRLCDDRISNWYCSVRFNDSVEIYEYAEQFSVPGGLEILYDGMANHVFIEDIIGGDYKGIHLTDNGNGTWESEIIIDFGASGFIGDVETDSYNLINLIFYSGGNYYFIRQELPLTVGCGGDYSSIQEAVDAASAGDTVYVCAGTYYESVSLDKSVNLVGAGNDTTTISLSGGEFEITGSNLVVSGFHITNGLRVYLNMATNVVFEENKVTSMSYTGIYIWNMFSDGLHTIRYNTIDNANGVMEIQGTYNNDLIGNTFRQGEMFLLDDADYLDIKSNCFIDGAYILTMIFGGRATDTVIENNIFYNSSQFLSGGFSSATILGNHFEGATMAVDLNTASDTIVQGNVFYNNGKGIQATMPMDLNVKVYGNYFVGNTQHATDIDGFVQWDNGYPSGGNYWDDYAGVDVCSGVNQDICTGGDDFGDTPYTGIDGAIGGQDNYPSMTPWVPPLPLTVGCGGDYSTIQAAVDNATDGDTVYVCDGTYNEDITIGKSINLQAESLNAEIAKSSDPLILVTSDWANITGFTISPSGNTAISFSNVDHIGIFNNSISIVMDYVAATNSHYNRIEGNNLSGASGYGIYLTSSTWNEIRSNTISGEAFYLSSSSNNTIENNTITGSFLPLVLTSGSDGNLVLDNEFTGISMGIVVSGNYNTITGNLIRDTLFWTYMYAGLHMEASSHDNLAYHNNFINNEVHGYDDGTNNLWDNGYPSGGNYWDDYSGTDTKYGPFQDQAGSDGMGDTAYTNIWGSAGSSDTYPLMQPWNGTPVGPPVSDALTVGCGGDYATIQEAIDNANDGDTVYVCDGQYSESITVDKQLKLEAESRNAEIMGDASADYTVTISASWTNITGFTIDKNAAADGMLHLDNVNYVGVIDNLFPMSFSSQAAVWLNGSKYATIEDNDILNQSGYGILSEDSDWSVFRSNQITGSWLSGMALSGSYSNQIGLNTITGCWEKGITMSSTYNNHIIGNTFTGNYGGLKITSGKEDTIVGNDFLNNNGDYGLELGGHSHLVYHNNFIGNNENAIETGRGSSWDNGYPSGGNYWDDYAGSDSFSGPFQNLTGADGLGDTPYTGITGGGQDGYPLMQPWNGTPVIPLVGTTHYVNCGGPGDYATIQAAIDAGGSNNIYVCDGKYYESIEYNGNLIAESRNAQILGDSNPANLWTVNQYFGSITGFTLGKRAQAYGMVQSNDAGTGVEVRNNFILPSPDYVSDAIFMGSCGECLVEGNDISGYRGTGIGDSFDSSTIRYNHLSGMGISIGGLAWMGVIEYNTISDNTGAAISLGYDSATVRYNNFINNGYGVYVSTGCCHNIYHNNFIGNSQNAYVFETMVVSAWDDGYPQGGNYWSDYPGVDEYHGPGQNLTGSDGIGDTPYAIPGVYTEIHWDYYPLMAPMGCRYLPQGNNFVSVSKLLADTSLESVLASIAGKYDKVTVYDPTDAGDHWKDYTTYKPGWMSELTDIDHTMGLYISITDPAGAALEVDGAEITDDENNIQLYTGWNHVSFPSLSDKTRDTGLNNLAVGVEIGGAYRYDTASDKWVEMTAGDSFVVGGAYRIYANQDCLWDVPV